MTGKVPGTQRETMMKFGDMTPEQRKAATDRALDQLQRELHANAETIGRVLDDFDVEDVVAVAAAHSLNSFELAEAACNAFADAVEDYVAAFETESDRPTLAAEGQELLARMGVTA